jgi:hypothetical protein
MIDISKALQQKLEPKQGADEFKFEAVGDQLIFKYQGRRSVKTKRGDNADLIDVQVLSGEKFDPALHHKLAVDPGARVVFLNTCLTRDIDREQPSIGDVIQLQLAKIDPSKNRMKVYGFEILDGLTEP